MRTDIGFIGFVVVSGHVAVSSNSKLRSQWTGALLSSSSNLKKEEFWKTWLFSTTGGFFMPKLPVIFRRQTIRRKITVLFTQFKLYKILNKSIIMFAKKKDLLDHLISKFIRSPSICFIKSHFIARINIVPLKNV